MLFLWLPRTHVETLMQDCHDPAVFETLRRVLRSADIFGETTAKAMLVLDKGDEAVVSAIEFARTEDADRAWERMRELTPEGEPYGWDGMLWSFLKEGPQGVRRVESVSGS